MQELHLLHPYLPCCLGHRVTDGPLGMFHSVKMCWGLGMGNCWLKRSMTQTHPALVSDSLGKSKVPGQARSAFSLTQTLNIHPSRDVSSPPTKHIFLNCQFGAQMKQNSILYVAMQWGGGSFASLNRLEVRFCNHVVNTGLSNLFFAVVVSECWRCTLFGTRRKWSVSGWLVELVSLLGYERA